MLSKNNQIEAARKHQPAKQRFALKKMTMGVASVLVGLTFMGGYEVTAHADTPSNGDATSDTMTAKNDPSTNNQQVATLKSTADDNQKVQPEPTQTPTVVSSGGETSDYNVTEHSNGAEISTPSSVNDEKVTDDSEEPTITIKYVDDQNNVWASTDNILKGQIYTTVDIPIPDKYKLKEGQPTTYTFNKAGDNGVLTIHVVPDNGEQWTITYNCKVIEVFKGQKQQVYTGTYTFRRTINPIFTDPEKRDSGWGLVNPKNLIGGLPYWPTDHKGYKAAELNEKVEKDGEIISEKNSPIVLHDPLHKDHPITTFPYVIENPDEKIKKSDDLSLVLTITYVANEHTQKIVFVDGKGNEIKDPAGKPVNGSSYEVTGKTGETVDPKVADHVPAGWELVPGVKDVPSEITFGSDDPAAIPVQVQHGHETVAEDDSNWDTHREVTQNIIEKDPVSGTESIARTMTLKYNRTGVKDKVTGATKWNDWVASVDDKGNSVTNFPEFDVSKVGYKASSTDGMVTSRDGKDYVATGATIDPDSLTKDNNVQNIHVSYVVDEPARPTSPTQPDQPTQSNPKLADDTNVNNNYHNDTNNRNVNTAVVLNQSNAPQMTVANKHNQVANQLPQTGNGAGIVGLGFASLTAMFGLAGKKRHN